MRFAKLVVPMLALALVLAGSARALPCLCVGDTGPMGPAHAAHAPRGAMAGPDDCCGGTVPAPAPAPVPCCGACLSQDSDYAESLISGLPLPASHPTAIQAAQTSLFQPVASLSQAPALAVFFPARSAPLFILFRSLIV